MSLIPELTDASRLDLDPKNPRIINAIGENASQRSILKYLWENADVRELVDSIAANGYFQHEPVFAVKEGDRLTVIEGNRRLAALKVLLNDSDRQFLKAGDAGSVDALGKQSIQKIPVIGTTRDDSWKFIGYRHVSGPLEWDPVAKARYIEWVKTSQSVSIEEIANALGDKNKTVERMYEGMRVLRQAEERGLFSITNINATKFAFSHLYTAISYPVVKRFLGTDNDLEIPEEKNDRLRELMVWIYGDRREDIEPVVQKQNPDLGKLRRILESEEATEELRNSRKLDDAHVVAQGIDQHIRECLTSARSQLRLANRYIYGEVVFKRIDWDLAKEVSRLSDALFKTIDTSMEQGRDRSDG